MITFSVVQSALSTGNDVAVELNGEILSKSNNVDLTDGQYLTLDPTDREALYDMMEAGYVIAENENGVALTAANILAGSLGTGVAGLNGVDVFVDEGTTLVFGVNKQNCYWSTSLGADRAVALSVVGAVEGCKFKITRLGGGFNLNVGTGPLKAVPANAWCEVTFDGTAWMLSKYGAL